MGIQKRDTGINQVCVRGRFTDAVLDEHGAQFLIHGDDNFNTVSKDRLIVFSRTPAISSSMLVEYNRAYKLIKHPANSDSVAKNAS
jgi:hypothetical protein